MRRVQKVGSTAITGGTAIGVTGEIESGSATSIASAQQDPEVVSGYKIPLDGCPRVDRDGSSEYR